MDRQLPRELGRIDGARPGPLLICVGGVHGNEPGGVHAAERFLASQPAAGCGRLVFLAGNLRALREGVRYVDVDLNRIWSSSAAEGLEAAHEVLERAELRAAIDAQRADGPWERVALLDLHSTSGEGPPFAILADTLQNRLLAEELPIPNLLGLEERIDGTLLAEFGRRGEVALCVEGGVNLSSVTVDAHEAAIRLIAAKLGIVPARAEQLEPSRSLLRQLGGGAPRWSRLTGTYAIEAGEQFTMQPGFQSFSRVEGGALLAHGGPSGREPILAPKDALLVMPRYQGQGSDGFFLAEELGDWWRPLSRTLRRAGLREFAPDLFEASDEDGSVLVAPEFLPLARRRLLALLGYHVADSHAGVLRFRRRLDPAFDSALVAEDGKTDTRRTSTLGIDDPCVS